MDQASPPQLNPAVFTENLAAVRRTEPQLAARLAELAASSQAVASSTRDGRISFRIPCNVPSGVPGNPEQWFGRTSIPAVRAAALLDRFEAGLGNVLLPGLGQGYEVSLLLQRLARCRAVFVWEPDEQVVMLALRLHDWAAAIAEQRLVFLGGPRDTLTATLVSWFSAHPGHLCPTRIMMWPWATPPELAEIRTAVQAAYESVEQSRGREMSSLRQQLAEMPLPVSSSDDRGGSIGKPGRPTATLILSLQPRDEVLVLGDALTAAASAAGEEADYIAVRSATDVHPLARVRRLADTADRLPDLAILLNATRHEVRDVLPEQVPAVSWLDTQAVASSGLAGQVGDKDMVAVTHSRGHARALQAGFDASRLTVCPLPCLSIPSDTATLANVDRPIDVVIMTDLPLTSAERFGYNLPTHLQLWTTAVELLETRIDSYTDEQGSSVLAAAEKRLGLRIDDPDVRRPILEILSTTVANALLWRRLFHVMTQAGFTPAVIGHGWSDVARSRWRGPVISLNERVRILEQAKLLIHADVTGEVSSAALLAAGCGAVLVARSHPSDVRAGGLHTLFENNKTMLTFRTSQDLTRFTRQLLGDVGHRRSLASQAAEAVKSYHTPEVRLRALRSCASSCSASSQVQS